MRTLDYAIGLLKSDIKYNQSIGNDTSCEEQHLGWLEELKAIKDGSIPIILGKAELELHDKAIRNKAIDDFVEKFIYKAVCEGCSGCCNCHEEGRQNECEDYKAYMEISEQLKAGGENE